MGVASFYGRQISKIAGNGGNGIVRQKGKKLGEKTETYFESCRVGELNGFGEMKRKGRQGRKGEGVKIKERKFGNEMERG